MALVKTYDEKLVDLPLPVGIDLSDLVALPAVIDPHVHFRVPGLAHKEDWVSGARAAIAGGVTTVFDMPNTMPPTTTANLLQAKKQLIEEQLLATGVPLRHYLYLGATTNNLEEIEKVKNEIIGIKLFMGASTGNLLVDNTDAQEKIFALAAELKLPVVIHAESEGLISQNKKTWPQPTMADHSKIRNDAVAAAAVAQAIELAQKHGTTIYILHVSSAAELELIRAAKRAGVKVYAEATPHHLFLNTNTYETLGAKAQMNPPLRTSEDQAALWEAVRDGTIDCIGTDHAPHTLDEKALPYPQSPSGVPGIETALPLLLNAYHQNKIGLKKIVELTSLNPRQIFNLPRRQASLPEANDWVVVNLNLHKEVRNENLKTKCGWSPFNGWGLTGWPVYTILNGIAYDCTTALPIC